MNPTLPLANINSGRPLTPQSAWKPWMALNQLADELWQSYENEFLNFCIGENEMADLDRPLPFD